MPKRFPPIPKVVRCPGGDVPVSVVPKKEMQKWADKGEELLGYYNEKDRYIWVLREMPPEQRWRVFYHEWSHVLLEDSGITNGLNHEMEEALCDAISAARMRERWG